ncbi:serine/threonine-protein kinase [Streptomyces sp. NPDC012769]|uniref:serine/threonine-protein kinase n=1 Tax=Streptomyces sp. NPDC012769 TaxID=3364848 RepID=UPI0036BD110A
MQPLIPEDPSRIGPYRLVARLGAGGMGLVYLGRSDVGRTVAVKVVQAEYAENAEFRRRFAHEVAAARRVGGAWTAAVLDADTDAAVPWVATQYVAGPPLSDVVARDFGPLPEASVRSLANGLARALTEIHAVRLIHRDLKPQNVLVTVDGPRVIDFGIARALETLAEGAMTRTGAVVGSPGFMSPEQVRGQRLTSASDVFCLGSVLAYAATGRSPFGAVESGLHALMFRVAEEEPDLRGVPEALLALVRQCLRKDPALRPTPQEVAARTTTDPDEPWLPARLLTQLGRNAAQLLDFAPGPAREPTVVSGPAPVPAPAPTHPPTYQDPQPARQAPAQAAPLAPRTTPPSPRRAPDSAASDRPAPIRLPAWLRLVLAVAAVMFAAYVVTRIA